VAVLHSGTASKHHNVARVDPPFACISCSAGQTTCHHWSENLRWKLEVKDVVTQAPRGVALHLEDPSACHQNSHSFRSSDLYLVTFLAVGSESMVTEIAAWIDSHLFQTIHFQQSIQETVSAPDWEGREGSSFENCCDVGRGYYVLPARILTNLSGAMDSFCVEIANSGV
jgi:hypothetical protein